MGIPVRICPRRRKGVTLTELLITLAVAGLLGAIALPGFSQMLDRLRVATAAAEFRQALSLARAEAMRRRARVDLVPLHDTGWTSGWQVLIDADNNQKANAGDTVLHTGPMLPSGLHVDAHLRELKAYIAFDVSGRPRSAKSSAVPQIGSFVFRAGDEQRKIIISFLGRVRSCDPVREKASC